MQPQILGADCEQILQVVQTSRKSIFAKKGNRRRRAQSQQVNISDRMDSETENQPVRDRALNGHDGSIEGAHSLKSRRNSTEISAECEMLSRTEQEKQMILVNSSRFKVRSSDLESLEMRFEVRKLEVCHSS